VFFLPHTELKVNFKENQLFVSADGRDTNDGSSWTSSIATLQHAFDVAGVSGGTIHVRGTLFLTSPATMEKGKNVTIVGEPGSRISGAVLLSKWSPATLNGLSVWKCAVPAGVSPRELFVGHSLDRATNARLPREGFFKFDAIPSATPTSKFNEGQKDAVGDPEMPAVAHPEDAEVVVHHKWSTSNLPLASVDPNTKALTFSKKSVLKLADKSDGNPSRYYIKNALEGFKEPDDWYWSSSEKAIYYYPKKGEDASSFIAEVPSINTCIAIRHSSNITIKNLKVDGTEFAYPANSAGDPQGAISVSAAVSMVGDEDCTVDGVSVAYGGTYGFEVSGYAKNTKFTNCQASNMGGGGIKIGMLGTGTTVENCQFQHLGLEYPSACGVWIGDSGNNTVSHNRIWDTGYTGISVGWTWGYGKSSAIDNVIEDNSIEGIGRGDLSDMGGIYCLGVSPGTVIRHNRVDAVKCADYGAWGIYLDEGSSNILVQNNVVTGCQSGSFHEHYGQDNTITNNIFAFGGSPEVLLTKPEQHTSFTLDHNIVIGTGAPLILTHGSPGVVVTNNDFWQFGGKVTLPANAQGNVIGDPKFNNAEQFDFAFGANSPAAKLGIQPIDLRGFGPPKK
jgi:parallel beta-helix repeat protein